RAAAGAAGTRSKPGGRAARQRLPGGDEHPGADAVVRAEDGGSRRRARADAAVGLAGRDPLHGAHALAGRGGAAVIEALGLSFALTLARVGSFVALLPLLGVRRMPRLVKLGLTVALTVLWFGSPGTVLTQEFVNGSAKAPWVAYALAMGREAVLGGVLGYAF